MRSKATVGPLPAFTLLMVGLRDFLFVPPLLALVYCLYVWFRKSDVKISWIGILRDHDGGPDLHCASDVGGGPVAGD